MNDNSVRTSKRFSSKNKSRSENRMPSLSVKKVTVASPKRSAAVSPKRSSTVPPHFMEDALTFFFAIVEPEIVKLHPSYISPTVDEFVYGLKKINKIFHGATKSSQKRRKTRRTRLTRPISQGRVSANTNTNTNNQAGGDLSENMKIMFSVLIGTTIGSFDTPCAQLFSYIAIMLYALWGYKLVSDILPQQLPGADSALMVSDPAGTITSVIVDFVKKNISSLSAGINLFEDSLQRYSNQVLANYEAERTKRRLAEHIFASKLIPIIKRVVVMQTYKIYVVLPLSCSLAALGFESCWRECNQLLPIGLLSGSEKPEL